jgi:hypothetical protein
MLEPAELNVLEATLLPSLERHHLRLMAHGLRTLQAIAGERRGPPPPRAAIAAWAARQPLMTEDPGFAAAFIDQLDQLAGQLVAIAAGHHRDPLALELEDLISWSCHGADLRTGRAACDHLPTAPAGESP